MTERGKIHNGSIVLDEPINLPEGTEVIVHVEPVTYEGVSASNGDEFEHLPFFGMWADRDEMSDNTGVRPAILRSVQSERCERMEK